MWIVCVSVAELVGCLCVRVVCMSPVGVCLCVSVRVCERVCVCQVLDKAMSEAQEKGLMA